MTIVSPERLARIVTPEARDWAMKRLKTTGETIYIVESPYEGERDKDSSGAERGILCCLTAAEMAEQHYPEWAVIETVMV